MNLLSISKLNRTIFISVLLCILLLVCNGCSKPAPVEKGLETTPYVVADQVNSVETIAIYTFDEKSSRLESNNVQLTIQPDQTKAEVALNYLLSTSDFDFALNSYNIPDYTFSIAEGVAKVHITNKAPYKSNPYKYFALHYSIVNTLSSIDGINYVCVYAGDKELSGSFYMGPREFLSTNLEEMYDEQSDRGRDVTAQNSAIIYYADREQNHIVPEYSQIFFNINSYKGTTEAVIAKLSKTPSNYSGLMPTVASDVAVTKVSQSDGNLHISFNKSPCHEDIINKGMTYSSIYHSIISIYPQINSISFAVGDEPIQIDGLEGNTITKDSFPKIIGSSVTLYLTQDSKEKLYAVTRYLSAGHGINMNEIMQSLYEGPTAYEDSRLISSFMGGLTTDNLIGIRIVNDTAILNFDTGFYNSVKKLSKEEESIMIYSIVNTLTNTEQIQSVQFLINNQSFETINDHIYYSKPLLSNPGLMYK